MDASLQAAGLDFRLPQSGHAIGSSPVRLDGIPKVTGGEKFGGDSFPADALAVLVVRSPHYHASFAFGDLEGWTKAHPGIAGKLAGYMKEAHVETALYPFFAQ